MIAAMTVIGIDVSRDWLEGLGFPGEQRFRSVNSSEGHDQLIAAIQEMPGPVAHNTVCRFVRRAGQTVKKRP